jgi:ketosteroid isomerase-like protein
MESAGELVRRFLTLMESRRLDAAETLLAPDALILFPGGKQFASQREMVAAAQRRYRWVKKHVDRLDALGSADGDIVYVLGTLYGVNVHGVPFDSVRYIDRFVVRDGLIARQEVWNDLAESGVLARRQPEPPP